jgi:hypothetical protein
MAPAFDNPGRLLESAAAYGRPETSGRDDRMFWKRAENEPNDETPAREPDGPILVQRDAQRPATILRVAGEYEERGAKILELFKEVRSAHGRTAVVPIHLLSRDGQESFVEVATRPWSPESVEASLHSAAVLRDSEHAAAEVELLSAYPVPLEVEFFYGRSAAALLQLDLLRGTLEEPEEFAEIFREAAGRRWGVDLAYEAECLPLAEELLMAALDADEETGDLPPILNALAEGLGCFVGETIRREAPVPGSWREGGGWGDDVVLELGDFALDPVGKAHAFLHEGPEDSVAFYAEFVLDELRAAQSAAGDAEPQP